MTAARPTTEPIKTNAFLKKTAQLKADLERARCRKPSINVQIPRDDRMQLECTIFNGTSHILKPGKSSLARGQFLKEPDVLDSCSTGAFSFSSHEGPNAENQGIWGGLTFGILHGEQPYFFTVGFRKYQDTAPQAGLFESQFPADGHMKLAQYEEDFESPVFEAKDSRRYRFKLAVTITRGEVHYLIEECHLEN